jgi:hypothetical protein
VATLSGNRLVRLTSFSGAFVIAVVGFSCSSVRAQVTRTVCEAARDARARNSPAAPGLERQCAATKPGVALGRVPSPSTSTPGVSLGRVKPAPVQLGRVQQDNSAVPDSRSICEAAADARKRNSPAAAGLERRCENETSPDSMPNGSEAIEREQGDVRLSRIFTGGGTQAATAYDFVELRNRSQSPLDLRGWSLQYASQQGTSWQVIPLTGMILPDRIFLIAPADAKPDLAVPLQLGMTSGKLALVRSTHALQGNCPTDSAEVVDFIGYGAADCPLTDAAAAGSADVALVRAADGCTDTRDNKQDINPGPPEPLDRAKTVEACAVQ